jgi:putative membrane protein insertion efficiency factor
MLGQTCRFYPSCSHYAEEAIERFGLIFGGFLALKRLISCHPFSPGGHDPVPEDNLIFRVIRLKSDVSRETL